MAPAIVVEGVSKLYRISHVAGGDARSFQEAIRRLAAAPWRRLRGRADGEVEDFWALRDVSFTVEPGEVVGILGANGAGKSTLLKVLSRIVRPTTGRVRLRGRMGSLLEVGVGFHPELSGRDNVYLSGAILGMRRREIQRKFDEIVAFSEIEQFLDTPVKRYSSGMYVRLAFAVAAHLEPDILVLDEVLAVGDAAFQVKCLERVKKLVAREHRTVLIVSHNVAAMGALCTRGMFFYRGRLLHHGDIGTAMRMYSARGSPSTAQLASFVAPVVDLAWAGPVKAPAEVRAAEPFTVEREYIVNGSDAPGDFVIRYFATTDPHYAPTGAVLLGTERISAPAGKTKGPHAGKSGLLRAGRPGPQYVSAVLSAQDNFGEADETNNVTTTKDPTQVTGLADLVVDNADPGYAEVGSGWVSWWEGGYGGDLRYAWAGGGANEASWRVAGLRPGRYSVAATWNPYENHASNATYRAYDGDAPVGRFVVDQRPPPDGPLVEGTPFQTLGQVQVDSGSLRVVLSDAADGHVVADAIRITEQG
jgi:ABC-type polysaccharide/polyol phosphate transport system ATPase subunit